MRRQQSGSIFEKLVLWDLGFSWLLYKIFVRITRDTLVGYEQIRTIIA
jgi:hypothetical protein